jgi:hypothetical protein
MNAVGYSKNSHPQDVALIYPKGGGSRHRAQGKKNNNTLLFSLRLAPYALCLTAWSGKTIEL